MIDAGCDTGPRLAQAVVPVEEGDDEDSLQARIQVQEHRLYPQVLQWISEGKLARGEQRWGLEGVTTPADHLRVFDGSEP